MRGGRKDETGNRYGKLTVLKYSHTDNNRKAYWECLCDCGNKKIIQGKSLRRGTAVSCGCHSKRTGENNPNWRGGRIITTNGYVTIWMPQHPNANCLGYVFEHTLVMEKMIGRNLLHGEMVHHCNGDRADNRPYNLRLFACKGEHVAYHYKLSGKKGMKRRETQGSLEALNANQP